MEPKSQDWHRADIKSALEKRYYSSRIALLVRPVLSPDSLRNVFTRSLAEAERIIADALGIRRGDLAVALWRYANKK